MTREFNFWYLDYYASLEAAKADVDCAEFAEGYDFEDAAARFVEEGDNQSGEGCGCLDAPAPVLLQDRETGEYRVVLVSGEVVINYSGEELTLEQYATHLQEEKRKDEREKLARQKFLDTVFDEDGSVRKRQRNGLPEITDAK